MFLKNISARLVTVNPGAIQIKPGNNPAVELPDEIANSAFVKLLIKEGILIEEKRPATAVDEEVGDGLDEMTKADLFDYAESLGADVKSSMNKSEIIEQIRNIAV